MTSGFITRRDCHYVFFTIAVVTMFFVVAEVNAQQTVGTLATTGANQPSITDNQLDDWITQFIPNMSDILLVLTECYGGDKVGNFADNPNVAVASATSPGEQSTYGGYDKPAADALKPGAGTTGQTVHDAGAANGQATPSTGGGMGLGGFPLDPVGQNDIESRHVLVYAGQPDGGNGTSDVMQRDKIKSNFAGDASVTTVGGGGGGGWDKPGTAKDLKQAIKDIGTTIANSPNPDKEQFILFVTDHGDLHRTQDNSLPIPPCGFTCLPSPYEPTFIPFDDFIDPQLSIDPDNVPGWSVFIDAETNGILLPEGSPLFNPGDWELHLNGSSIVLEDFIEQEVSLTVDDVAFQVGDEPGEGWNLFFPQVELEFLSLTGVAPIEVELVNNTEQAWTVSSASMDSGSIGKLIPEPASAVLLFAGICGLMMTVRRRNSEAR